MRHSRWLPPDMDLDLYRELVPQRPSPAWHDRGTGPSAVLMQLEREQRLWAAAHELELSDDTEAGAA